MPSPARRLGTLLALAALSLALPAQEKGLWRATSTTARSITGDVAFGNEKLVMNLLSFTLAEIRPLQPAEIVTAFNTPNPPSGAGHIFRTSIPADRKFLHKNTLCGSEDTQWVVTYVEGRTLQVALFSGNKIPDITPDTLNNSTTLCGTYTYTR